MIIMPSTPRLRTPERSTTNSPDAASSSGVEAAITDRMMASSSSMRGLPDGAQQADAVDDERIAGQHVEQQDALEHLGEVERHLHRDLRVLAADEGERKKETGDQNADRIEPPQKGDDDGGEAVTRRYARIEMADRSRHFDDAGETGQRARNREGEEHEAVGVEPGEPRRAAPTTRISKPLIVCPSSTAASMTAMRVRIEPACRRPTPSNKVGIEAAR